MKYSACLIAILFAMFLPNLPLAAQSPTAIPGKEYSENADQDDFANFDHLQNLRWSGFGTTVDAFDYSNSGSPPADPDQVDALANGNDYLFQSVFSSQVPFVVSFSGFSDIYYHNVAGNTGVWATRPQVRTTPRLSDDLDALELWGDVNTPQDGTTLIHGDDANFFSVKGDFVIPNGIPPAISVYRYDPTNDVSTAYMLHDDIRNAVATLLAVQPDFDIDVDAMMLDGQQIIFSLEPNNFVGLDGGELFTWRIGDASAQYLFHGGRLWDTSNQVGLLFGVNTENIDAFEGINFAPAIPEPSGAAFALGVLAFATLRRGRSV